MEIALDHITQHGPDAAGPYESMSPEEPGEQPQYNAISGERKDKDVLVYFSTAKHVHDS